MDEIWQSNTNPDPRLQSRINVITLKHFPLARAINVPCSTRLLPLFNLLLSFCLLFHFYVFSTFIFLYPFLPLSCCNCCTKSNQVEQCQESIVNMSHGPCVWFQESLHCLAWMSEWYPWNLDWGIIGFISQWWRSKINSIFDVWSMKYII